MISTLHRNAASFFAHDVDCIRNWFAKRFDFHSDDVPLFRSDITVSKRLDLSLSASGSANDEDVNQLEQVCLLKVLVLMLVLGKY